MAQYHDLHYASELPVDTESALWSEIIAWRMRKQVNAAQATGLPTSRL